MSVKFTKRVASQILGRGENSIRLTPEVMEDIRKAITRDDVRKLLKDGAVTAIKPKSELHPKFKIEVRRHGAGKRKGSSKARRGRTWEKKVRSQRMLLERLKLMGKVDNTTYKRYYLLVKGNALPRQEVIAPEPRRRRHKDNRGRGQAGKRLCEGTVQVIA